MYKLGVAASDGLWWRHLCLLKTFFNPPQLVAKAGCTVALSERWWHHWHHWWSQKGRSWCLSCVSRVNLLGSAVVNGDMTKCTGTLGIYTKCTSVPSIQCTKCTVYQWTSVPSVLLDQCTRVCRVNWWHDLDGKTGVPACNTSCPNWNTKCQH